MRHKNLATHSMRLNSVNMIAAVGSDGSCFYTINQGRTNSKTFILFVTKLIEKLNEDWENYQG